MGPKAESGGGTGLGRARRSAKRRIAGARRSHVPRPLPAAHTCALAGQGQDGALHGRGHVGLFKKALLQSTPRMRSMRQASSRPRRILCRPRVNTIILYLVDRGARGVGRRCALRPRLSCDPREKCEIAPHTVSSRRPGNEKKNDHGCRMLWVGPQILLRCYIGGITGLQHLATAIRQCSPLNLDIERENVSA